MLPLEADAGSRSCGPPPPASRRSPSATDLRPDVILMDMDMPYLSGLATMERITSQEHVQAILVLTGVDDAESVLDAFAAGTQGYLREDQITDELLISAIFAVASGGVFLDACTFAQFRGSFLASRPRLNQNIKSTYEREW